MTRGANVVEAKGLTKRFGSTVAVDGLDLVVPRGAFVGLLGPNGAGKSTTVALLTGLARPSAGTIALFGAPFDPDDPAAKRRMGVVPEQPPLFERLTGHEQLVFNGRMFGLDVAEARRRADELLALLRLDYAPRTLIADYSRGMAKKLAIGCALIHGPELLFLDEPLAGVDALSAEVIRDLLSGLVRRGATALLTTHDMSLVHAMCERVAIIHEGRLRAEVEIAALVGRSLVDVFREAVGEAPSVARLPAWLRGPDRA